MVLILRDLQGQSYEEVADDPRPAPGHGQVARQPGAAPAGPGPQGETRRHPMTCERIEGLLSAYLEGGLSAAEKAEVDAHLAVVRGLRRAPRPDEGDDGRDGGFPRGRAFDGSDGPALRHPGGSRGQGARRSGPSGTAFDWLGRPALQPVYAAFTVVADRRCPSSSSTRRPGHPQGRSTSSSTASIGAVEKLYADAGGAQGRDPGPVGQRRQVVQHPGPRRG
ncbi:MAG: zf-HC2 domain-containing protein [Candidatus Moduliflexus flocculans]|nr:zf-HC2 domain-containing protein [Candidatus Moduliflexus flocculans]